MRRYSSSAAALMILSALSGVGCHRQHVATARAHGALASPDWDYCWWAAMRTTIPPDSVAVRFERGFTAIGLTDATWAHSADTAWAHAGPTPLRDGEQQLPAGVTYESRAVAYATGDSTHFRYWFRTNPPQGGWARAADSVEATRPFAICGRIAQAADIQSSVPKFPTGEETLAVWRHRP